MPRLWGERDTLNNQYYLGSGTLIEQSKMMRRTHTPGKVKEVGLTWDRTQRTGILANKGHSNYIHVFVGFCSFLSGLMCVCNLIFMIFWGIIIFLSFPKWRNRGSEKLSDFLKNKWQVRSGEAVTIVGIVGGRTYEKLLFHKSA